MVNQRDSGTLGKSGLRRIVGGIRPDEPSRINDVGSIYLTPGEASQVMTCIDAGG